MVKYSRVPQDVEHSAQSHGSQIRVHYKHCREVCHTIQGMKLNEAKKFLRDVLHFRQAVPFTRHNSGCARHAQAKQRKVPGDQCGWPKKATQIVLGLLLNAEANAEAKKLDKTKLYVWSALAQRAIKQRRRTYRAHGRITAYKSCPAHVEIILRESSNKVAAAKEEKKATLPRSRKRLAQLRVRIGGGIDVKKD